LGHGGELLFWTRHGAEEVAAAQENGVRSGNDDQSINENKAAVEDALKRLGIEVDWWPPA
jgi:hypothetical protein